jgi:hypothetical protein
MIQTHHQHGSLSFHRSRRHRALARLLVFSERLNLVLFFFVFVLLKHPYYSFLPRIIFEFLHIQAKNAAEKATSALEPLAEPIAVASSSSRSSNGGADAHSPRSPRPMSPGAATKAALEAEVVQLEQRRTVLKARLAPAAGSKKGHSKVQAGKMGF